MLWSLPDKLFLDRAEFDGELSRTAAAAELKLTVPIRKAICLRFPCATPRRRFAGIWKGGAEPDPELRDTENVPLLENVDTFFDREVRPHVPDAWIDTTRRDLHDAEVGIVGYEINFNRYFYEYRLPRPLEEIEADIQQVEQEILAMLREVTA